MLAFTDVHYVGAGARAACVLAGDWGDAQGLRRLVAVVPQVAPYVPGRFFERELPPLCAVLAGAGPLEVVVVDGYAVLDDAGTPGLGAHLHAALGVPVVGIAKTSFRGSQMARRLERPGGVKPLFVTAAGLRVEAAHALARRLHGAFRIPTLLKEADALARGHLAPT